MSLRVRLVLVILAAILPSAAANLAAHAIDGRIQARVAELRRETRRPLVAADALDRAFSIEGHWDARGFFAADSIESLPRQRRPKLRGAIEAVTPDGSIVLYGVPIRVPRELAERDLAAPSDGDVAAGGKLRVLAAGTRVEVSCRIDDGDHAWIARKLRADDVKASDKLKGTVRSVRALEGGALELDLGGLRVRTPMNPSVRVPRGPVHRMETASAAALSLQECETTARELLNARWARREARLRKEGARASALDLEIEDAEERLVDAHEELAHAIGELREGLADELGAGERADAATRALAARLEELDARCASAAREVDALIELAERDLDAAQRSLSTTLEPRWHRDIAPGLRAAELQAQEQLSGELGEIAERSTAAARLSLATNLAGIALALVLGLVVARSISRPVSELERAARRIGGGDLEARVPAGRAGEGGELGALAQAFNGMAEQLGASTVSIARLNDVIDSLAGGLLLVGPDGLITSVNPAARTLLGRDAAELNGLAFHSLWPAETGRAVLRAIDERGVESRELALRRKDGVELPVAFSGAALGGRGGYVCLVEDLRERKRMDEALRRSLGEKELLLRELHHRVKNNLQVVASLLDLQSREVSDPKALEKFQESQDRVRSMVLIHEQLYGARDLAAVDLRAYLSMLTAHLEHSHVDPPGRIRIEHEIDELRLDLDRALACGLIVNELVTNAIKHAFPHDASGTIRVRCAPRNGRFALSVEDDGRGLAPESAPDGASLGLNLVRALVAQLEGELSVDARGGTKVEIEFP